MKNPYTFSEMLALNERRATIDFFGPNSEHPYMAFDLADSGSLLNDWLQSLPCPVIGIGTGLASKGCDVVLNDVSQLGKIAKNITAAPIAAMTLVQHLRAIENLPMGKALTVESFAYGTLQRGPEFKGWLSEHEAGKQPEETGPPILTEIKGKALSIHFNRPKNYNAFDIEMRDALCEVLDMALLHDSFERVTLTGIGKTFSIGGALWEFGQTSDPATAHWIRTLRLPATRLVKLRDKLHVHVNGAAIGAGLEMASFAGHVTCSPKAWFQLPELKYGLIPGAGGTVSIMNRIGRQRTNYMALSMEKVSAKTAVNWGLVDRAT